MIDHDKYGGLIMRVAALSLVFIVVGMLQQSYAAIYDFTVELPASDGSQGRGVAPKQRLTFTLDTTQAQAVASTPVFVVGPLTLFSAVPLTVFTYGTNTITTTSSMVSVKSLEIDFSDRSVSNVYDLRSGTFGQLGNVPLSSGMGTSISFTVGTSLPVTNVSNILYLRQDGTLLAALEGAASVPEPAGWAILCAALGLVAGVRAWERRMSIGLDA